MFLCLGEVSAIAPSPIPVVTSADVDPCFSAIFGCDVEVAVANPINAFVGAAPDPAVKFPLKGLL